MKPLKKSSTKKTEIRNSIIKQDARTEASCLPFWVTVNEIKNEKGELIEFTRHKFLLAIYGDQSQVIAVRKPSQVGASTWAILKEIHSMKFLGINQIHTLPSDRDVWGFVPTKVDKIIKANGLKLEKDSAEIKGLGKGFCYYKGTFTEKAPIIISSDRNIYDEVDKSKMSVIGDYASRMSNSELKEEIWISTPTIPDFGIDAIWQQSDQKHWRFNCPHCGYRQHMEWDTNIDFKREIYVCQQCRGELTLKNIMRSKGAGWEARFPDEPISGYWISQMMCWDAKHVIQEYNEAIQGLKGKDEQYFFNFILGMP
ncbi:MAG: phage terminase large subunit family protein, partial [Candidatus Omnitrophota bacterium]